MGLATKQKTTNHWLIHCLIVLLFLGLSCVPLVHAQEEPEDSEAETTEKVVVKEKIIQSQSLEQWHDGIKADVTAMDGERVQVAASRDAKEQTSNAPAIPFTNEEDETADYQSIVLFDYTLRDISDSDGLSFYIHNMADNPLQINLTITPEAGEAQQLLPKSAAWLLAKDEENFEAIPYADDMIAIPANFEGTVYVPLKMYRTNTPQPFNLVETVGIAMVMPPETQQIKLQLGNLTFLTDTLVETNDRLMSFAISGSQSIIVPQTGAVMTDYAVQDVEAFGNQIPESFEFYLTKDLKGVALSVDGILEITAEADLETPFWIYARAPLQQTFVRYPVQLVPIASDFAAIGVPAPAEVETYTSETNHFLNKWLGPIRLVVLVGVALYGMLVWRWWTTARQYSQEISQEMKQRLFKRKKGN